ncbi:MAG: aldehyde dehydrogenase family protein, partial [Prosthecobacter sp.]|nr:aldehyde dehydrogenase family protein [Prosthecobacter sp.]
AKGWYCRPCFFTGVQPAHTIAQEEIFGPVLSVMTFRTPEEAVVRAKSYVSAAIAEFFAWEGGNGTVHALNHLKNSAL